MQYLQHLRTTAQAFASLQLVYLHSYHTSHRRRSRGSRGSRGSQGSRGSRGATCSADRRDRSVYYVRPPQNVIASYAYALQAW